MSKQITALNVDLLRARAEELAVEAICQTEASEAYARYDEAWKISEDAYDASGRYEPAEHTQAMENAFKAVRRIHGVRI